MGEGGRLLYYVDTCRYRGPCASSNPCKHARLEMRTGSPSRAKMEPTRLTGKGKKNKKILSDSALSKSPQALFSSAALSALGRARGGGKLQRGERGIGL